MVSCFSAPYSHFRLTLFSFHFWMKTSLVEHECISAAFMLLFNWFKNERKMETIQNHSNKNQKNHLHFFHYLTRFKLCACNYFAFVCLTVSFAQSKLEFVLFFFLFLLILRCATSARVSLCECWEKKYVFPVWHAEKWKMVFCSLSVCVFSALLCLHNHVPFSAWYAHKYQASVDWLDLSNSVAMEVQSVLWWGVSDYAQFIIRRTLLPPSRANRSPLQTARNIRCIWQRCNYW